MKLIELYKEIPGKAPEDDGIIPIVKLFLSMFFILAKSLDNNDFFSG